MRLWFTIVVLLVGMATDGHARQLDRMSPAPVSWHGHVFKPRFDYPLGIPKEKHPWLAINFRNEPERYLDALLAYALEGQDRVHWDLARNRVRQWHHLPWLGPGPNGREYIHGLTRARDFGPGELSARQTDCRQNWVMAFYNGTGGALLNHIWRDPTRGPDFRYLPFLLNTVAVKLVFTEATASDDPALVGAPELQVAVHAGAKRNESGCPAAAEGSDNRSPTMLRLVQLDIAVREQRASYKTGWVFGSFRYDGSIASDNPWQRLKPIGLMWGNDPQLSDEQAAANAPPRQSILLGANPRAPLGRGVGA